MTSVADLCDEHEETIEVCEVQFRDFGGRLAFSGRIRTVRCYEDNSEVKALLATPGDGCVLVVDGGGSLRRALVGDVLAGDAVKNGWAGIVVFGAVRDTSVLATLDIGIKALGTIPMRGIKRGEGVVDTPVAFGGVVFVPGDILHADGDGIAVIAADA
ncbi:ribonuclease E activity regulator RraA [Phenylobacterium sp.]|uniref:ribonuclease E activity regulator RraA n=1 Tax=Phenylobacterium sp. TaxID=1871053 RepID=UPI00286B4A6F|nr:ribonuclease E activity regulator RraA [Phenylobacterium sp.]